MSKFNVGDRVGAGLDESEELTKKITYTGEYGEEPAFGEVKEVLTGGKVKVLWDNEYLNEVESTYNERTGKEKSRTCKPVTVDTKILSSEADAKAKYSELEKEYEAVADQVRAKLDEAGALIKEAHKIASQKLKTSLGDMYDATDKLESVMDACGWRTSSWHC